MAQRFAGITTQPADQPRADEARAALKEFAGIGQAGKKAIDTASARAFRRQPHRPRPLCIACWNASITGLHGGAQPPTK